MHRPTRQHNDLTAKLERKLTQSKKPGKKAKRWKKWIESYAKLNQDTANSDADQAAS
jgi:hypothetical protein